MDEHVRCENAHDLHAIMQIFGSKARYDDEPLSIMRAAAQSSPFTKRSYVLRPISTLR